MSWVETRWGLFDETTGKRVGNSAFFTRERAEERIAALRHDVLVRGRRPDLLPVVQGIVARTFEVEVTR